MKEELLTILTNEVKPALGCTGPISVAFTTSAAREAVGGTLEHLTIIMDKDTYKNSIRVATPGTPYFGVREPGVTGAIYGHYKKGLEVLNDIGAIDTELIEKIAADNCDVEIRWDLPILGVYIEAIAKTDKGIGKAITAQGHDRLVFLSANDIVILKDESYTETDSSFEINRPIRNFTLHDLFDFAREVPIDKISFLQAALDKNYRLSMVGIENRSGAGFGAGFANLGKENFITKAKMLAAAASDARMAGEEYPATSCAGSGNVGITASVPLIAVAESLNKSQDELLRALALSYLVTIMGKAHIGRLSPMCACAMTASLGIGAGTCLLMGGDYQQIEYSLDNIIGSTGGILCDGAKFGCALKLAVAVGNAIECAQLAIQGVHIPAFDGLVDSDADRSLALLGRIASRGMLPTDEYMAREFITRENI